MRALLLLSLVGGCAPPPYDPDVVYVQDTAARTTADTDTTPSIAFVLPGSEAEIEGCSYVVFRTENITLVDPAAMPEPTDGYGHVHIYYTLADDQGQALDATGYEFCPNNTCIWDPNPGERVFSSGGLTRLTASLRDNGHNAITDADGNEITATLDVRFTDGPCALIGEGDTGGGG